MHDDLAASRARAEHAPHDGYDSVSRETPGGMTPLTARPHVGPRPVTRKLSLPRGTARLVLAAALLCGAAGFTLAQDTPAEPPAQAEEEASSDRIITIDGSGGTQRGNLRSGPIIYEHPDPHGIHATVSTLTILGSYVELTAPEGTSIARGGERTATFLNGVEVNRGRLTATGPQLVYSEATGLGVMEGGIEVVVESAEEGEEPVFISAAQVSFDVDTDRSTSTGDVQLDNGNQSATADTLVFEEEASLAVLTSEGAQVQITRTSDSGDLMTITADEIRVLTEENRLYARGNVTVVDGSITSRGQVVFFDDEEGIAEVIGTADEPAEAVDSETGARLVTDRIKQDIEYDFFEAIDASVPSAFDPAAFALRGENQ
jgi:lipopolysaccharide transport protein LptA